MNRCLALAVFLLGCNDPCNGTCGPDQACVQQETRNLLQYIGGAQNYGSWSCQTTGPLGFPIVPISVELVDAGADAPDDAPDDAGDGGDGAP